MALILTNVLRGNFSLNGLSVNLCILVVKIELSVASKI